MKKITFLNLLLCICVEICLFRVQDIFADVRINNLFIGMPRTEITSAVLACENDLCGEILFGGTAWNGRYILDEDTLTGIAISLPTHKASLEAAFKGIEDSPYVLLYAETNLSYYNFIANVHLGKKDEIIEQEYKEWVNTFNKDVLYSLYFYAEPDVFEYLEDIIYAQEKKNSSKQNTSSSSKQSANTLSSLLLADEQEFFAFSHSPEIEDVILTLITVTPEETRILSGTVRMIRTRLQELKASFAKEPLLVPAPANEGKSSK